MNKTLFANTTNATDTVNDAGGAAYALSNEAALLQMAVTGVFNDTYYVKAEKQLETMLDLANKCSAEWVAKTAIYARQQGFMKDAPALLVAALSKRDSRIFHYTFDQVIDNVGMLRNFVQIIRSGVVDRKSLGSAPKKAIARFLAEMPADQLFYQSVGTSPSLEDVLKLAHPRPPDPCHDALYGYLLGRPYVAANLPALVTAFEAFKQDPSTQVLPSVDFRMLTALSLTPEQWSKIGLQMTWNQLRLNLNTLARHGCFNDPEYTESICEKLNNPKAVSRAKVLPFALFNTMENLSADVPNSIRSALGACMDATLLNAPYLSKRTLVLVDSSGSMGSPVTGNRGSASTKLTCNQAASYFAASLLKRNPDNVLVVPFDTNVYPITLNPRDSVETITKSLTRHGGGTDVSCGLRWALGNGSWENVLIISDNESWVDGRGWSWSRSETPAIQEWTTYRRKNPTAKLICWDITPCVSTQVKNDRSVLNVGGWTESVYSLVDYWFESSKDLNSRVQEIYVGAR